MVIFTLFDDSGYRFKETLSSSSSLSLFTIRLFETRGAGGT